MNFEEFGYFIREGLIPAVCMVGLFATPVIMGVTVGSACRKPHNDLFNKCMLKAAGEDGVFQREDLAKFLRDLGYEGFIWDNKKVGWRVCNEGVKFYSGNSVGNPDNPLTMMLDCYAGNKLEEIFFATNNSLENYLKNNSVQSNMK